MLINQTFKYIAHDLPEDILLLKEQGRFTKAVALIDGRLRSLSLSEEQRACLVANRELMRRLPLDFPYGVAEAVALGKSMAPDFTGQELAELIAKGRVECRMIEGEARILGSFIDTLLKCDPDFRARAGHGSEYEIDQTMLRRTADNMRAQGGAAARIRLRASVRIKDEAFAPGTVRVHIPIPRACATQGNIALHGFSHEPKHIANENALQRTVCFEEELSNNREFFVEYEYTRTQKYAALPVSSPAFAPGFALGEELPLIVFTPRIRSLAAQLTEGLSSPLEKARAIYDYITLNVRYAFTKTYFCMENIADECARTLSGDCGVMALLLISLMRCAGIPAEWESGLYADPSVVGSHDWATFYIEPFGWLYADPSFGTAAVRAQDETLRRFYFGNLDPYRMAANGGVFRPFDPPKAGFRADPYDNQKGEAELDGRGLSYNEFEYAQKVVAVQPV